MIKESKQAVQFLRIFCALLMLSLGFAHKPVQAIAAPSAAYDEAYRFPDGTFAEICADHAGDQPTGHDRERHSGDAILFCEACLLASSILVPVPHDSSWLKTDFPWLENKRFVRVELNSPLSSLDANARAPPAYIV